MRYKFLCSGDVNKVLVSGTMIISSLGYFRKLEGTAGDIGDPLEGASELTIRDGIIVTEGSQELEMLNNANIGLGIFKQFVKVENGGVISFGAGTRLIHVLPELYIYSFSQGNLEALTEEMCVRAPLPYDACLRIKDATELGRACYHQGVVKNLSDCRPAELFKEVYMKVVEYVPRSIDVTDGKVMAPDPFQKAERFSRQSEIRFVFVPHDGVQIPEQRLVIAIPDLSKHFEMVFRDRAI